MDLFVKTLACVIYLVYSIFYYHSKRALSGPDVPAPIELIVCCSNIKSEYRDGIMAPP
jgi:hypothetical protein